MMTEKNKTMWNKGVGIVLKKNKLESLFDEKTSDTVWYASGKFYKKCKLFNKYMTPDFVVGKSNKVIEVFGDYWHKKEEEEIRISRWNSIGFECLVVWESSLLRDFNNELYTVKLYSNEKE